MQQNDRLVSGYSDAAPIALMSASRSVKSVAWPGEQNQRDDQPCMIYLHVISLVWFGLVWFSMTIENCKCCCIISVGVSRNGERGVLAAAAAAAAAGAACRSALRLPESISLKRWVERWIIRSVLREGCSHRGALRLPESIVHRVLRDGRVAAPGDRGHLVVGGVREGL